MTALKLNNRVEYLGDEEFIKKFRALVDDSAGPEACWPWTRCSNERGYGRLGYFRQSLYAHRVALEISLGRYLYVGMNACHHCDNPSCCNPVHLFEGSARANVRDCMSKGRHVAPPIHDIPPRTVLTPDNVRDVRARLSRRETIASVARLYGVGESTIRHISRRNTWRHVT